MTDFIETEMVQYQHRNVQCINVRKQVLVGIVPAEDAFSILTNIKTKYFIFKKIFIIYQMIFN